VRLSDARSLLIASPAFMLERIALPRDSRWEIHVSQESWLLVIDGSAGIGSLLVSLGEGVFLEGEHSMAEAGPEGCVVLLAYSAAEPSDTLLTIVAGRRVS
jgi:mannose-6-phosphate isomerase